MSTDRGRLTATNVPVRTLILKGFRVKDFQVSGGPGWLVTERYDIVAKTENTAISDDDLWLLLQPLLKERFQWKVHRETRQLPVYSLVVAKGGPKLVAHVARVDAKDEATLAGRMGAGKASLVAMKTSMSKLADVLGDHLDRTVVDRTGDEGKKC